MKSFENVLRETNDSKINSLFTGSIGAIKSNIHIASITFDFNPVKRYSKSDKLFQFFDYYHQYSTLLLVPNIKITKYDPISKTSVQVIGVREYLNYVMKIEEILEYKSSKDVFLPISLRFSQKDLSHLLNNYTKRDHRFYWIDFEGKSISPASLGRLRFIMRKIDKSIGLENTLIIFSNIKREIISNIHDDESPASDALAQLAGADIIGSNREPRKKRGKQKYSKRELLLHKARILNVNTYYYVKPTKMRLPQDKINSLLKKSWNIAKNTHILNIELRRQTEILIELDGIKEYMKEKRMLNEYNDGQLLKQLFTNTREKKEKIKLTDIF